MSRWISGLLLVSLSACSFHRVDEAVGPAVPPPDQFQTTHQGAESLDKWWQEFDSDPLNSLMDLALQQNLDLKQAWARLAQVQAQLATAKAARWPQINAQGNVTDSNIKDRGSALFSAPSTTRWAASASLSYEVDLWKKISSQVKAARWGAQASRADVESTALVLTGQVMELWLTILEQRELLTLLQEQLKVNQTLLDLLELRFTVGEASSLDVYQQRQTLAATESQVPPVEQILETTDNSLHVLLGHVPQMKSQASSVGVLPELPPLPEINAPAALLAHRPDLRAAQARLIAADHEVAAAIAERLPQLELMLSYDVSTSSLADLLQRQVRTALASIFQPIIDGGRRRAEVERRRAVVEELTHGFTAAFLNALLEVENALVAERQQLELLRRLQAQEEVAKANQREAERRYRNGLNDYLPVIAAVQSLQTLQRRMITERKLLLSNRVDLYLALGGTWTQELEQ